MSCVFCINMLPTCSRQSSSRMITLSEDTFFWFLGSGFMCGDRLISTWEIISVVFVGLSSSAHNRSIVVERFLVRSSGTLLYDNDPFHIFSIDFWSPFVNSFSPEFSSSSCCSFAFSSSAICSNFFFCCFSREISVFWYSIVLSNEATCSS
uniref:Uncharacterized protein n=1 Tax=Cacopsylla melanoneura TaxID=428564 RepID=A0A8D8TCR0_9HEMI